MLVAMLDVVVGGVVAPVLWAAVLILAAIALAALRGRGVRVRARRGTVRGPGAAVVPSTLMTVHATLGLVVMAALVLAMIPDASPVASAGHHGSGASFGLVAAASALCFGLFSVFAARSLHGGAARASALDRGQLIAIGTSTAAMGVSLLA